MQFRSNAITQKNTGIKILALLLVFSLSLVSNSSFAQRKIFIKLDDFGVVKNNHAAAVMDTIIAIKLKAAIGVIAKTLDTTAKQEYEKYLNDKNEKLIEVWHHGYDHSGRNPPTNTSEFNGTSYDFQSAHFKMGDELIQKKLGVQMHTFGSPVNESDTNTVKIIEQHKTYKVFLLKGVSGMKNGILYLNNEVAMETGTGVVNFDFFVKNILSSKINTLISWCCKAIQTAGTCRELPNSLK